MGPPKGCPPIGGIWGGLDPALLVPMTLKLQLIISHVGNG